MNPMYREIFASVQLLVHTLELDSFSKYILCVRILPRQLEYKQFPSFVKYLLNLHRTLKQCPKEKLKFCRIFFNEHLCHFFFLTLIMERSFEYN